MGIVNARDDLALQQLLRMRTLRAKRRNAINHINRQVETVNLVQDRQFKRRVDIPLLLVPTHMEAVMILPLVRQLVDQRSIRMEVEDDRLVRREQAVEVL